MIVDELADLNAETRYVRREDPLYLLAMEQPFSYQHSVEHHLFQEWQIQSQELVKVRVAATFRTAPDNFKGHFVLERAPRYSSIAALCSQDICGNSQAHFYQGLGCQWHYGLRIVWQAESVIGIQGERHLLNMM